MSLNLPRPDGVSPRVWRIFLRTFTDGCRFWTSVDGNEMDVVIVRRHDAVAVLDDTFGSHHVPKHQDQLREAFVEYDWLPREHFDDPYAGAPRRGKGWIFSDTPTPFPVLRWCPHRRDLTPAPSTRPPIEHP
jgi:hypothetical protein